MWQKRLVCAGTFSEPHEAGMVQPPHTPFVLSRGILHGASLVHGTELSKEVVDAPSLEALKVRLDGNVSNLM